jgi:hypothetical protein
LKKLRNWLFKSSVTSPSSSWLKRLTTFFNISQLYFHIFLSITKILFTLANWNKNTESRDIQYWCFVVVHS